MVRIRLELIAVVGAVVLATAADAGSPVDEVDPRAYRAWLSVGATASIEESLEAFRLTGDTVSRHRAFRAFRSLTPQESEALAAWLEAAPDSAAAGLALAEWELGLGWRRRGTGMESTLDSRSRIAIRRHARNAVDLAEAAIQREEDWLHPHLVQLEAARLLGDGELAERAWSRGFARAPSSYALWSALLDGLTRRWGGSYTQLEQAAASAQAHSDANARLRLLLARADADRAHDLRDSGLFDRAIEHYDLALEHGEQAWLLGDRGWTHYHAGRHSEALRDLDRATRLEPFVADHHHRRAHVLMSMDRLREAEEAAILSVVLAPAKDHFAWLQHSATKRRRAEWDGFVGRPTLSEAARRGSRWLGQHAMGSFGAAGFALASYFAWRAPGRRRGGAPPG